MHRNILFFTAFLSLSNFLFAWDGSFPANVFSFIPFEGKVFLGRNAIASGATPSGPFLSKEEVG